MKSSLIFSLLIVFVFYGVAGGQENEGNEIYQISIPENIKQEIVRRILVYKFKPQKRPKVVYLSKEGINQSWFPNVPNIEFRLLSDEEIEDRGNGVYFFTEPELIKKTYNIGFAFGEPGCSYIGDGWSFRITNNKLRLWYVGGIGGGCGGGRDFKTAGKLNTYPNELEGYKLFDKGKLKGLKLTVSTREDVKKNFGSDCENSCEYNDKWKIDFSYFGSITKETTIDNKRIKYVPKEELIGKIASIRLIPKQQLSFSRVSFPSKFSQLYGFAVGDDFDSEGRLTSAVGTSYKTYLDRYGLKYEVYESGYTVGNAEKDNRRKGSLIMIEYSIPEMIEETMFVEQQ